MTECPNRGTLERFTNGKLDDRHASEVRAHLETCTTCHAVHDQLRQDREFLDHIRLAMTKSAVRVGGRSREAPADSSRFPVIEGYRIVDLVGKGAMGVVYRAIQENLGREVALKLLPAVVGISSPSAIERFRREAEASARLHHTNIVPVHDFGQSPDGYYYAMDFIEGDALNRWIAYFAEHRDALHPITPDDTSASHRSGTVTPPHASDHSGHRASIMKETRLYYRQVARWIAEVADGLDYAHEQGIIHRDIKPSNLILSTSGRLMIADFGLAKADDEPSFTVTGSLIGTVSYLSPEQAMAKRVPIDRRTDIYSLGATMYELLCFERAFKGETESEILAAVSFKDPVRPRKILSAVPQELETICLKTLEKSPDARYQTARELSLDLLRFVDDLPIAAKRPNPLQRGLKLIRRHKAASVAVLVAVLLGTSLARLRVERDRRVLAQISKHVEKGNALQDQALWAQAEEEFQSAIELRESDYVAWGNLARLYKEWYNDEPARARLVLAQECADKALRFAPPESSVGLWNLKGVLLKKLERLPEAIAAYDKAIEIQPDYIAALDNRCVAHALSQNLAAAEADCRRASQVVSALTPNELAARRVNGAIVWRNLAAIQAANRNTECAESINNALSLDPTDYFTHLVHAYALLTVPELADDTAALNVAEHASMLCRGSEPTAEWVLALAQIRNGVPATMTDRSGDDSGKTSIAYGLVSAMVAAAEGRRAEAAIRLEDARRRLEVAEEESTYLATADRGQLWIITVAFLKQLQGESESALEAINP